MRTKDVLSKLLRDRLTSPVWANLKRALLGNELIEFGANVLELNDLAYEVLHNDLYVDTASLKGAIYISKAFEVPFYDFKPSFIKITMPVDGGIVYPPFSVVITAGTVRYTNVEYVTGSTSTKSSAVTLYQGNVVCATQDYSQAPDLGFLNVTPTPVVAFYIDDAFGRTERYVKLSRTVIPTSVYGYVLDTLYRPLSPRTPLNSDPTIWNFALIKGYDNITNVHFGNGENDKILGAETIFIFYLDCTFNKHKNASFMFSRAGEAATLFPDADIISEFGGEETSEVQRKTSLKAELAKNSVAATFSQIRAYVNSFPEVSDSNPTKDTSIVNNIIVYIKPVNIAETDFSDLEENLRIYGEIVTTYKAVRGTPTYIDVILTALSPVTGSAKNEILSRLEQELSYDTLTYKSDVSVSLLAAIASEYTSAGVSIDLKITLDYLGEFRTSLGIRPSPNSLQIKVGTTLVAWDSFGAVFGYNTSSIFSFSSNTFKIGDLIYTQGVTGIGNPYAFLGVLPSRQASLTSNAIDIQGITNAISEEDYFVVSYPDLTYRVFPLSREFFDGEGSILQSTSVSVLPVYPTSGYQTCSSPYNILDNSVIVGDVIYHFQYNSSGSFIGSYMEVYKMSPDKTSWGLVSREFLDATELTYLGFIKSGTFVGFVAYKAGAFIAFAWDTDASQPLSIRLLDVTALETKLTEASVSTTSLVSIFGGEFYQAVISLNGGTRAAYRISGALITLSVSSGVLTFAGDFTQDFTSSTDIVVLGDKSTGVYYKDDTSIRFYGSSSVIINDGASIPRLTQIGSVAYESNELLITDSTSLAGGVITFSLAESLSRLDDSIFPVINSIAWDV